PLGLEPAALPTERGCLSNAAGNCFMAGVGFSFIFSWLLMLIVLVPFVLGGNVYMLFCQSLHDQQLFELLDTPGFIPNFNLSQVLGEDSTNISELYRQCQDNAALWQTLHLDRRISLDELFNITQVGAGGRGAGRPWGCGTSLPTAPSPQYTAEISTAFERVNITLSPISLLNQSQKDLLLEASRLGQPPDFAPSLVQLNQNVTRGSLLDVAVELERLAEQVGGGTKEELEEEARLLRELAGEMDASLPGPLVSDTGAMARGPHPTAGVAAPAQVRTNTTLQKVEQTQASLQREMATIIKNETRAFLQQLLGFFETYVAWAKSSLTREVARCKPVAQAVDSVEAMACDFILDSVNAFWFSLGWCTALLLPSIILTVRLAKFYRRMEVTDVY
ncbi:PRM1A protein, partial [Nothoprocta ornata]|nr:PRM1A protein [Nothoprocta ornata]